MSSGSPREPTDSADSVESILPCWVLRLGGREAEHPQDAPSAGPPGIFVHHLSSGQEDHSLVSPHPSFVDQVGV